MDVNLKEGWVPKNWCFWTVMLEKTIESHLDSKEIRPVNLTCSQPLNIHWKNWCWGWNSNTLATWCKDLSLWKRLWCWERLKEGGEGENRGWDGWMASTTYWTWIWTSSRGWWWTGKPGMLQSISSQRVKKEWETELKWSTFFTNKSTLFIGTNKYLEL